MRPLRLALKNFTAFRDEQVIDFTDLDLFALTGPIGSGKSSVLDAMTYALYGRVERVGDEPKFLVSQGQPRMAVTFDFRVGDDEVRVTRSTQASGNSRVLLERRAGDEFVSFGEGADQVRSANKLILDLIGLDYDAFTRSVVLPQGKFAQFLVGDPVTRRKILTELLGLELFERMAKRSNAIAGDAKVAAETIQAVLDSTYASVTRDHLAEARAKEKAVAKRLAEIDYAREFVTECADRVRDIDARIDRLQRNELTILDVASSFEQYTKALEDAIAMLGAHQEQIAAARIEIEKATDAVEGAGSDLDKATRRWGPRDGLLQLRERILRWKDARAEAEQAADSLRRSEKQLKAEAAEAVGAEKRVTAAGKAVKSASATAAAKKKLLDGAHRHDLVGTLVVDLKPGSPCPVCDRPLERLPEVNTAELKVATRELKKAEAAEEHARSELAGAQAAQLLAARAVETTTAEKTKCGHEAARRSAAAEEQATDIRSAFSGRLPTDPVREVERRTQELDELIVAAREAKERLEDAERIMRERETAGDRAKGDIKVLRAGIESSGPSTVLQEILDSGDFDTGEVPITSTPPEDPDDLVRFAVDSAVRLKDVARRLAKSIRTLTEERSDWEGKALAGVPEGVSSAGSVSETLSRLEKAARAAGNELMEVRVTAAKLDEDLVAKKRLSIEASEKMNEHELYKMLSRELQRNRIVDYLQAEALKILAGIASVRLDDLSGGRYRLAFENEGFCVIDAWNGDERRRVNTLSGGETFLASLALALALSEQVQLLAVTERHRLESLFLDEGFGSLDVETLEVAVAAIEQLGGEDRLVGVITHVTEVAERLPLRIEVVKSPRGSRLVRREAEAEVG